LAAIVRICLVYDCLFPWTVGGAERLYRNLGERLVAGGHDVTYLTLRQWDRDLDASYSGVRVVPVGPRLALYRGSGERRILPPLVFGAGVLAHLVRHRHEYDIVHTASFPYFSLLAAGLLQPRSSYELEVDWYELWTREYWREYLGAIGGRVGWAVQRLCLRVPQRAFCFARLTADRLRTEGLRGSITVLTGGYAGSLDAHPPEPADPVVVFAGRHIPEKRPAALVAAMGHLRELAPGVRAVIFGDGPERPRVLDAIAEHRVDDLVTAPGFVPAAELESTLRRALCMVLPSRREGYGLVVIEAAAQGVPSVVVAHPDNAAVELVEDGVNGIVAASADPRALAAAIAQVQQAGPALRASTSEWFARNAHRLSLDGSLERVVESYGRRGDVLGVAG
jgi:glycosyltransferase involved in cell wall biosynthesis